MGLLNITLAFVATAATVLAAYFGWLQLHTPRPNEVLQVGDKIKLYLSRKKAVEAFADMLARAPDGSAVFGQCRSCTDYPDSFYQAIMEAAGRGIRFRFIASPSSEGREFITRVKGISTMTTKIKEIEHSRVFGIEGREAIYIVAAPNGYVGIHVIDPIAAKHQQAAFESEWGSHDEVRTG